jgi:hypothetical protein
MPRVIFLNRFFYPDHSATSRMVSDLAFELASSGKDVTSLPVDSCTTNQGRTYQPTKLRTGFISIALARPALVDQGLPGRAMDYLSFYFTSWRCALSLARPGDIIVAKT